MKEQGGFSWKRHLICLSSLILSQDTIFQSFISILASQSKDRSALLSCVSCDDAGCNVMGLWLRYLGYVYRWLDPSPRPFLKLVHYEAHTVGKLAVGILLECFLVLTMIIVKNDEVTMKINKFNIETRVDLETNQMIQRSRDGRTSTTGRSWIICTCIILIDVKYPDLALTKP